MSEEPKPRSLREILRRGITGFGARIPAETGAKPPPALAPTTPVFGEGARETARGVVAPPGAELPPQPVGIPSGPTRFASYDANTGYFELCRKRKYRVLDPEAHTVKKDEAGNPIVEVRDFCKAGVIPEQVRKCTRDTAANILLNTPPSQRDSSSPDKASVEGFYACADQSYNTFIAAQVLGEERAFVKQYVGKNDPVFGLKISSPIFVKKEEAIKKLEQQVAEAKRRPAPIFQRALHESSDGRGIGFEDEWGFASYTVPQEQIDKFPERYCVKGLRNENPRCIGIRVPPAAQESEPDTVPYLQLKEMATENLRPGEKFRGTIRERISAFEPLPPRRPSVETVIVPVEAE